MERVVIVGGGFGGLACARALDGAPVDVLLLDARNYPLFTPLLYQVATALLDPSDIARVVGRCQAADPLPPGGNDGVVPSRSRRLAVDGQLRLRPRVYAIGDVASVAPGPHQEGSCPCCPRRPCRRAATWPG